MEQPSRSPTPTLPLRHPSHCLSMNSQEPRPNSLEGLIPPPLFISKRSHTPTPVAPDVIPVTILDLAYYPPSSSLSTSSTSPPSSPTWSGFAPSPNSCTSTPASSAPNSPTSRPRAMYFPAPPSSSTFSSPARSYWSTSWQATPRHTLRRKASPKRETLRSLRAKESEACLQRIYDEQTSAYLHGNIFPRRKPLLGLESVWED